VIFAANFIYSMFFGQQVGRNPWRANGLEWSVPSPPGHGNFDFQPVAYRGPYEYGSPEVDTDYYPQWQPPIPGAAGQVPRGQTRYSSGPSRRTSSTTNRSTLAAVPARRTSASTVKLSVNPNGTESSSTR